MPCWFVGSAPRTSWAQIAARFIRLRPSPMFRAPRSLTRPRPHGPVQRSRRPNVPDSSRETRRGGSSLPVGGEYLYALYVATKTALILGGGGITGGMYELGALSAIDDFIVSGRKSGDFDLYVGISAGSILAAFLANDITVSEMCSSVLGEKDQGL